MEKKKQTMTSSQRKLYNYILMALQGHCMTKRDLDIVYGALTEAYETEARFNVLDGHIRPLEALPEVSFNFDYEKFEKLLEKAVEESTTIL